MREIQNLQSVNLERLPLEVRAHILQTIQDLTSYARSQAIIGVLIKSIGAMPTETQETGSPPWKISIQVLSEGFTVEQECENADVFTAVSEAKNKMLEVLGKIHSHLASTTDDPLNTLGIILKPETLH